MSAVDVLRFVVGHPLNRDRKLRSVMRFAGWQLRSRLARGPIVHDWISGARFWVHRGETGLTGNVYAGLHEFAEMGYLLHTLSADDLFVDVGANVGSYTLLAAGACGARVVAFEPVPGTYQRLVQNIRLNALESRVRCENAGVGREAGEIAFTADLDTVNHALAPGETAAAVVRVPMTPLDRALDGAAPALMKIDVEGFESPVVEGAQRTLANPHLHSVIMELNGGGARYGFDEDALRVVMADFGFRPFTYDPLQRALHPVRGTYDGTNTLFVRDEARVRERIARAPRISVMGRRL